MPQTIHVAVGVLLTRRDGTWHCLIAKRPHDTVLPGYWELPGGKIEPGEAATECLVREFREELDLVVEIDRPLPGDVVEHRYDHGHVRLDAYLCRHVAREPRHLAVTDHRWVTAADLPAYQFPPANDDLVRRIVVEMTARDQQAT